MNLDPAMDVYGGAFPDAPTDGSTLGLNGHKATPIWVVTLTQRTVVLARVIAAEIQILAAEKAVVITRVGGLPP